MSNREQVWVSPGEAAVLTGLTRRQLTRLADEGLVQRRDLPGVRANYRREDLVKLARNGLLDASPAN